VKLFTSMYLNNIHTWQGTKTLGSINIGIRVITTNHNISSMHDFKDFPMRILLYTDIAHTKHA